MKKTTFKTDKPSIADVFYYRAKLQSDIHQDVLERFAKLRRDEGLTNKQLAEATGKEQSIISRLLAEPGNWTLATISDLLLAMRSELRHEVVPIDDEQQVEPAKTINNPTAKAVIPQTMTASGTSNYVKG